MCLSLSSSSYKVTVLLDLGPALTTSVNLNYLLKTLFPDTITLQVRASTFELWGDTVQSIANMIIHSSTGVYENITKMKAIILQKRSRGL